MARVNPVFIAIAVILLIALAALCGSCQRSATGQAPIKGVLYSVDADSAATRAGISSDDLPLPELRAGVDEATREKLPPGLDFIVHLVPGGGTSLRLTSLQDATPAPKLGAAAIRRERGASEPHVRTHHDGRIAAEHQKQPSPALIAASALTIAPPLAASATQPPTPTAPAPPTPTQAKTFSELDDALRSSPLTQTLNLRLKLDDVSFRITHVGRVGDREAVRFAIANAGSGDFFVSIVNVSSAGKAIHSETAGPYSCGSGQEVFGIVHFAADIAVGKVITVELVQSGGEHRRFALKLSIPS